MIRRVLECFAHCYWGFLTALVSLVAPVLSLEMFLAFIIYEVDEDWHIRDKAFRDILEMMVGLMFGSWLVIVVKILALT